MAPPAQPLPVAAPNGSTSRSRAESRTARRHLRQPSRQQIRAFRSPVQDLDRAREPAVPAEEFLIVVDVLRSSALLRAEPKYALSIYVLSLYSRSAKGGNQRSQDPWPDPTCSAGARGTGPQLPRGWDDNTSESSWFISARAL